MKSSSSGYALGQIRKHWGGILKEGMTDADAFGATFPADMLVGHKVRKGIVLDSVQLTFSHFFFSFGFSSSSSEWSSFWTSCSSSGEGNRQQDLKWSRVIMLFFFPSPVTSANLQLWH